MEKERWLTRILRVVSNLTNILPSPLLENLLCARHRDETLQEFAIPEAATHTGQAVVSNNVEGKCCGPDRNTALCKYGGGKGRFWPSFQRPWEIGGAYTRCVREREVCLGHGGIHWTGHMNVVGSMGVGLLGVECQ